MSDGLLYRSLPAFTGLLVFMPACGDDAPATSDTDATDGDSSSGDPSTTLTTTESNDESTSSSSESSTGDEESDTGEPAKCEADSMCGAPQPEGWFGPFVIASAPTEAELPECPEAFPTLGPIVHDGFVQPADTECTCECEPPAASSCYARLVSSDDEDCNGGYYYYGYFYGYGYGGGNTYTSVTEECTNIEVDGFAQFRLSGGYGYGGADCTPKESKAIPPLSWEASIKACGLPETPLSCSDGSLCIPQPPEGFESTWCLYQQGDAGCPAGLFNTKRKFFMGVEDNRDCSDCNCGASGASCDSADLLLFEGPDCAGQPSSLMESNDSCQPTIAASVAVDYGPSAGTCPVTTQPHPIGIAEPVGDLTFCCAG